MSRLYFCLRLIAIAIAFPAIALYIAGATLVQAVVSLTRRSARGSSLRVPLRIWLSVMDWTKGIPVGFTYWEQYEAPVMLDEIAVHHDD